MKNITIKEKDNKLYLIKAIKFLDHVNEAHVKIVGNSASYNFVPLKYVKFPSKKFVFEISNTFEPLEKHIKYPIQCMELKLILTELLQVVRECQENDLPIQNLDVSLEHIYIDYHKKQVSFLYWPFAEFNKDAVTGDPIVRMLRDLFRKTVLSDDYNNYTRQKVAKYIEDLTEFNCDKLESILDDLFNMTVSLEKVGKMLPKKEEITVVKKRFVLVRVSNNEKIQITKFPFWIGQDEDCDYMIEDNGAVSHHHALFTHNNGHFYIKDNHTTNGTILRDEYIPADVDIELEHNNVLVLANEKFVVYINELQPAVTENLLKKKV